MPRYRLKANVGWIAKSETDFGVHEYENADEASEAAYEIAAEYIDAYAEEVGEDEE